MSVYRGVPALRRAVRELRSAEQGNRRARAARTPKARSRLAHDLGQPAGTPIYFAIDFDPYARQRTARFPPLASGRASRPTSIRSTRCSRRRTGRSASTARASPASASRRAARPSISGCRRRSAISARPSSSTAGNGICSRTSSRSSAATPATRSTPTWPIRRRRISANGRHSGPAAPHDPAVAADILASRAFVKKGCVIAIDARQRQAARRAEGRARSIRRAAS